MSKRISADALRRAHLQRSAKQAEANEALAQENKVLVQTLEALTQENDSLVAQAGLTRRKSQPLRRFVLSFCTVGVVLAATTLMVITGGVPSEQELQQGWSHVRQLAAGTQSEFIR